MGRVKPLLHKPLRAFALYSLILLMASIPVYVVVIDLIWITELDESNKIIIEDVKSQLTAEEWSLEELRVVRKIIEKSRPGISILQNNQLQLSCDSAFEITRVTNIEGEEEEERFRGLISSTTIQGAEYYIKVETNVEDTKETFVWISIITFIFFSVLVAGSIVINNRISRKVWSPFHKLLESLKMYDLTKDVSEIYYYSSDVEEFQQLNNSIRQLISKNLKVYNEQKAFTENASHELRTPLAIIKSKLDLLVQQRDVTSETANLISAISIPLSRLTRINKNLGLLAQIENGEFGLNESISLSEIIQNSLILFEDYTKEKALKVHFVIEGDQKISANLFLLETLIHNLISNAIRHTDKGSEISITYSNKELIVKNPGCHELNTSTLFKRFSRSTDNKVSSGLGLSIIQEIVFKYNWHVSYLFRNGNHEFKIQL